ncbi:MAG: SDR family NAD(P)-dependent oxidoreductase [Chthoniobacterales bacterium]|nr:SDR family NAD(P)-dependent oxidoreductase [Chthoniobacterales bacterium]
MLATSAGALLGASVIGRAQGATTKTDIGDMKPHVDFSLQGKSALVTGAARGIGRAIAVALAAAGADVMGLDICAVAAPNLVYPPATADDLAATGKLVQAQKRRWIGVTADIRDMPATQAAAERAVKEFGKLDIAIANAAIQIYGPLAEMSDENWKNVIDVNLNGTANTLRAVLPHMLSRKYGRIVIIASGQGRHGFKNGSAYAASKWGVIGLMKSVAWEVGKEGITVNCVEPGLVDTALTRNPGRWKEALKEGGKQPNDQPTEQEVIAARLPQAVMGIPWMQPDEVAPAVVFLCTDAANRVSGATYDASAGDSVKYTA